MHYGKILSLLLVLLLVSSCSTFRPDPEIKVVTKIEKTVVPIQPMPKPVQMNDIKIYVVSPSENFEEFKKEFEAKNGGDSYVAISIKDYENLSKNFAELRRYIEQQKAIILYYEKAVQPVDTDDNTDDK